MTFLADAFYGGKNLVGCASSASIFHWSWAWLLLPLLATIQTRMVKTPGEKKPPGLQSGHCWLPKRIMSCFSKRWSSAYYVEVTASSLLTWSSCSVAAERREWFWLLGQQNRLPRRKGAWRFPWNKESRMDDHEVQRFQSLVSRGHCKWFHTEWHMEGGSCLVFSEPPRWLAVLSSIQYLSPLILVYIKLQFIPIFSLGCKRLGDTGYALSFGIPKWHRAFTERYPVNAYLLTEMVESGGSRLDWRSRQDQGEP